MFRPVVAGLSLLSLACVGSLPARAADVDQAFFNSVFGRWSGPGEIVAGKYKGTKFVCDLSGLQTEKAVGMSLDGACRVGMFSQPMNATFTKGGSSYKGTFLDGSGGKGLDIVSGDVSGNKVVVGLDRKQLKGAMVARLEDKNKLMITISVQVAGELVPVLGMTLKRVESVKRAALAD